MRCKQCNSSFRLSIWIMQCGECKEQYCTKCMTRKNGICYCDKCTILITRPPDISELMKLKPKDLQEYLNRHNITTVGLVEKRELVDLLCARAIPVKSTKTSTILNKIVSNVENVLSLPDRLNAPTQETRPPRPPSRPFECPIFASTSSTNLFSDEGLYNNTAAAGSSNTLPKEQRRAPQRPPPPNIPSPPPRQQSQVPTTASTINSTTELSSSPLPSPRKIPNLADYETAEQLGALSAKELKIILTYNRVDFKGCVEKSELLEKVQRLWSDSQKYKYDKLPEDVDDLCKLCMDAPLDCVLLECGHIATCINCGKKLAECPICRQYVSRVVRTFKA